MDVDVNEVVPVDVDEDDDEEDTEDKNDDDDDDVDDDVDDETACVCAVFGVFFFFFAIFGVFFLGSSFGTLVVAPSSMGTDLLLATVLVLVSAVYLGTPAFNVFIFVRSVIDG